jgi:enoyl-[acyl-carrier protein] reductase III
LGINLNILQVGLIETDSTRQIPRFEQTAKVWQEKTMVGERILEAKDVADAAVFLASPLSDLIQGQTLVVDGGASIHA